MREKDEDYRKKLRTHLNRKLIQASENNNLKFIGRLLDEGQFNPDKQTLTRAIQRAMETGNDVIAVFFLNYCSKNKHRKLEIEFDFKVNNQSPLFYAAAKNNDFLVEALLNSGAVPLPKEAEYFIVDPSSHIEHSNVMLTVLKNLHYVNSKKILFLLLSHSADFTNVPISRLKLTLTVYLSMEKSASEKSSDDVDDTRLIDLILKQLKKENPGKFESLCVNIITDYYFFLKYPLLFAKVLSLSTAQIFARIEDHITRWVIYRNHKRHEKMAEYLFILMANGLHLDLNYIRKEMEALEELNESDSEDIFLRDEELSDKEAEDSLLTTPSLTPQDYALPIELLTKKLKQLFIPQEDLNRAANHFLARGSDKLYPLVAAGAKPTLIRADITRFHITNRNRLELELCRHAAKNNDIKILQLMLNGGLRFRDSHALGMLQVIRDEAKTKDNVALVDLLTPVLLKEQRLLNAKSKGIVQQRREDWLEHQFKLRPKMLRAIDTGNIDAIITLVAEGANPNFTGDGIQEDWAVSQSCAVNVRGVSPLHFACMHQTEETAIAMFQTLCDLGASLKIANEWTQKTWAKDLSALYQNSEHSTLYHNILKASVREAQGRVKAPLTDKARASTRTVAIDAQSLRRMALT